VYREWTWCGDSLYFKNGSYIARLKIKETRLKKMNIILFLILYV
jgi:hypothetical protein